MSTAPPHGTGPNWPYQAIVVAGAVGAPGLDLTVGTVASVAYLVALALAAAGVAAYQR